MYDVCMCPFQLRFFPAPRNRLLPRETARLRLRSEVKVARRVQSALRGPKHLEMTEIEAPGAAWRSIRAWDDKEGPIT